MSSTSSSTRGSNSGSQNNWDFSQILNESPTCLTALRTYTDSSMKSPPDQNERLAETFYNFQSLYTIVSQPEVRDFISNWVQSHRDQLQRSMSAAAGISGGIGSDGMSHGQTGSGSGQTSSSTGSSPPGSRGS